MKKKLLIDIDGVACDHAYSICEWIGLRFGIKTEPSEVTTWDHHFGPISFIEAVDECYPNYEFVRSMKVSNGFMDFYNAIHDKVNITFATARSYSEGATRDWIEHYFPGNSVVFTPQKALVLEQDFMIDDSHKECITCAKTGMNCLLLRQPWNGSRDILNDTTNFKNITYCLSFSDVLKEILSFL